MYSESDLLNETSDVLKSAFLLKEYPCEAQEGIAEGFKDGFDEGPSEEDSDGTTEGFSDGCPDDSGSITKSQSPLQAITFSGEGAEDGLRDGANEEDGLKEGIFDGCSDEERPEGGYAGESGIMLISHSWCEQVIVDERDG